MTITLFCAVVGVGSVFPVDIDITKTVGHLKDKIKEKKPGLIYFDADLLKLYLAREGDTWLNSRDEDIKAVKAKRFPDRIKNLMQEHLLLDETWELSAYLGNTLERVDGDIHVLVECQMSRIKSTSTSHYLMMSGQDGFDGSFMENWFSWHLPWSSLQSLITVEKEKRA